MGKHFSMVVPAMDTNDLFIKMGFCPDYVRVVSFDAGLELFWSRHQGNDNCVARVAAGDRTVTSGSGIKLVKFPVMKSNDMTTDPTEVEAGQWNEADGIQITADAALLADDKMLLVEAFGIDVPVIRAVMDGTTNNNTYFEDSSLDFRDAGVSTGWIIYNQSNGNYCYVGEVQRPADKAKYCRLTSVTAAGAATTAADFDTNDVCFIYPPNALGYPLSDIGAMT